MEIRKTDISENIKKNYNNKLCSNCNNEICKVYGGICNKYSLYSFFKGIKKVLGGK